MSFTSAEFQQFMQSNGVHHIVLSSSVEWFGRESCPDIQVGNEEAHRRNTGDLTVPVSVPLPHNTPYHNRTTSMQQS